MKRPGSCPDAQPRHSERCDAGPTCAPGSGATVPVSLAGRRAFLGASVATGGALLLPAPAASAVARAAVPRRALPDGAVAALGPLRDARAENTGEVLLGLPEGFRYQVLIRAGDPMTDGHRFPGKPDGMGAFEHGGKVRLVCNHELGAGTPIGRRPYDRRAGGGTTTLTFDPATRRLTESFVSSSGTVRNCAGGITPWGSWISCEETSAGIGDGLERQHGYLFEVPAAAAGEVEARPLRAMGLHYPEAVAIDPATGIAYITSDRRPCGLFRFVPDRYGDLAGNGKVQMLAIASRPRHDTRTGQRRGQRLPVAWVDIDDPGNAQRYRKDPRYTYRQGLAKGGATFTRGEGAWHDRGTIFFACSDGGDAGLGQIFALHLQANDVQALELIYESNDARSLAAPDNLCVSPSGRHLIVCEDGGGPEYLHLLDRNGDRIERLAVNRYPGQRDSEWAGACFSPDRRTLFANLNAAGVVFAIWADDDERWRLVA